MAPFSHSPAQLPAQKLRCALPASLKTKSLGKAALAESLLSRALLDPLYRGGLGCIRVRLVSNWKPGFGNRRLAVAALASGCRPVGGGHCVGCLRSHPRKGAGALLGVHPFRIAVSLRHHVQRLVRWIQARLARHRPLRSGIRLLLPAADPFACAEFERAATPCPFFDCSLNGWVAERRTKERYRIAQAGAG